MTARSIMKSLALSAALFAACSDAGAQGIACEYSVSHVIQAPDGPFAASPTFATAISPNGRWVVGYYLFDGAGNPRPFVFDTQSGQFTATGLPSWLLEASPADVNDHKIMVGTGNGPVAGQRGFVCDLNTGFWTELLPLNPPIGWSGATGISNSNVVCGWRSLDDGGDPVNPQTAFIWSAKDGFTDLGLVNGYSTYAADLNDTGAVTGEMASINAVTVPFVWNADGLVEGSTLAGLETHALAIGSDGTVVGWAAISNPPAPHLRAFTWRDGTAITDLGVLHGFNRSRAFDLNANTIVGLCSMAGIGGETAVIWRNGQIERLQDMTHQPTMTFVSASAISGGGVICAIVYMAGDVVSAVLAPIVVVGDLDGNCLVDIDDLLRVISEWGPHVGTPSPADLNADGVVNVLDLLIVIGQWT